MVLIIPPIGSGSTESSVPSWFVQMTSKARHPQDTSEAQTTSAGSFGYEGALTVTLDLQAPHPATQAEPSNSPEEPYFVSSHILVLSLTTRIF